ncbi:hypothetical protein SAMN05421823_10782 [Catalinimonas alkaloidigena]|uniref:Uncharacterized protein n=1 Tax=Catalinimonas alkaloidigena TaxID=1075417 RepID=A0A1G9LL09_9BACT|nr:hypothetical protein [Catalinimonas alkaloidigena]SDL62558.1 hypothetical protein SAMN05421823_10782 [Catalinimonas alkaloidigena]
MNKEQKRTYNLGYINGWLANMARINDKTNYGYDFGLHFIDKENRTLNEILDKMFENICESYELKEIEAPKELVTKTLIENWVYEFQSNSQTTHSLKDENNNFSLSDSEWKTEWVEELVSLLFATTEPLKCYELSVKNTKGFYCCDGVDYIFENESNVYRLHLSVSD